MKTLSTSTTMRSKLSLFLVLSFFAVSAQAKAVAMVDSIKGQAFMFDSKGNAFKIYKGAKLPDFSELRVEDSGQVTIQTVDNHIIHASSGTHIRFQNKTIELKSGNLWFQSMKAESELAIQTPNSVGKLKQGEIIYSFDEYYNRSQVMVIQGAMTFANVLEEELQYEITAGKFSILENKQNDGIPRQPTSVGEESFGKIVGLFEAVKPVHKTSTPVINKALANQMVKSLPKAKRSIASVDSSVKKGKMIFINSPARTTNRLPASATSASDYYEKFQKKSKPVAQKKTGKHLKIRFFGAPSTISQPKVVASKAKVQERIPASIPTKVSEKTNLIQELKRSSPFEKSLETEVKGQKRHSQERNKLIDELKSFDQAYQKEY